MHTWHCDSDSLSFFSSCITFSKLRECLVISIKGTRGVIYQSQKEALTYSYFAGPTLFCCRYTCPFIFWSRETISKQLFNLTHHGKLRNVRMFSYLLKSMISYQEKPRLTPKILHIFPRKQELTASLGNPCIWLYCQLIGTTASFATTNRVLPG